LIESDAMRSAIPVFFVLLFLFWPQPYALAQNITALPEAKAPTVYCGPNCVHVIVRNLTSRPQNLKLRVSGGNWREYSLSARQGWDFRVEVPAASLDSIVFEAALPSAGETPVQLNPGSIYEIRAGGNSRGAQLQREGDGELAK